MIALAVETSSPEGSVALWKDGAIFSVRCRSERHGVGARALEAIQSAIREAGCGLEDVDLFVAGRGPGNYSGIRSALTMVQALALPKDREAIAVDSGSALAEALFEECDADTVAVVGDARRGQIWAGVFDRRNSGRRARNGWGLFESGAFPSAPLADRIATSEWDRMAAWLPAFRRGDPARFFQGNRYPSADRLLALALRRRENGCEPDPFKPLYLHPAVRIPR